MKRKLRRKTARLDRTDMKLREEGLLLGDREMDTHISRKRGGTNL